MATANFPLPIPPNGYDATNPPALRYEDHRWELLFDDTTDELCFWSFRVPGNYASGPVLKIMFKAASATTGNFGVDVAVMAVTPGDAVDMDTPSFDTDNSANTSVPGTAGHTKNLSVTLTNADSMAAEDHVTLRLNRDAAVASDATGDIEVVGVLFEYTTT